MIGVYTFDSPTENGVYLKLAEPLEAGKSYRFRYLLDGERWENDWDADAYKPNEFGTDDSILEV